ncbi:hypothetical protein HDU67_010073 [Dinochytrium kinnereticum]|nr:hypothetical protein HDU67_010073 [Dinochytrium kinnereticum]
MDTMDQCFRPSKSESASGSQLNGFLQETSHLSERDDNLSRVRFLTQNREVEIASIASPGNQDLKARVQTVVSLIMTATVGVNDPMEKMRNEQRVWFETNHFFLRFKDWNMERRFLESYQRLTAPTHRMAVAAAAAALLSVAVSQLAFYKLTREGG